jgi:hypothetical protein
MSETGNDPDAGAPGGRHAPARDKAEADKLRDEIEHFLPPDLKPWLMPGKIRKLDDLVDYAAVVSKSIIEGRIERRMSPELRKWAELMFSAIAAQRPKEQQGDVNVITNIIAAVEKERVVIDAETRASPRLVGEDLRVPLGSPVRVKVR